VQPSVYIAVLVLFIILFISSRNKKAAIVKKMMEQKRSEGHTEMVELAKRFMGKECLVYAFDGSHQFSGIIREVSDGALLIENNGTLEAINLDFVIRIREYPRNKKGKKKSVVLD